MQLQRTVIRSGAFQRKRALKVMAWSSSSSVRQAKILKNAEAWVEAQSCLSRQGCTLDTVADRLRPVVAPHLVQHSYIFKGHKPIDQKFEDVVASVEAAHAAYDHMVYTPVFTAANARGTSVHLGLQWCLMNKATKQFTRGIAIERLSFDEEGRVCATTSSRSLLREERQALLRDPSAADAPRIDSALLTLGALVAPDDWHVQRAARSAIREQSNVHTPSMFGMVGREMSSALHSVVLPHLQSIPVLSAPLGWQDFVVACGHAEQQAHKWFDSWALPDNAALLEDTLAPGAKAYDGIGLSPLRSVGCEGPVLSYSTRWEASDAVDALHRNWDVRHGRVTDVAVAADPQVVFCSWEVSLRAKEEHLGVAVGKEVKVEGIALLLLDQGAKVQTVVQFACMPASMWSSLKVERPRVEAAAPVSSEVESVLLRQAAVPRE